MPTVAQRDLRNFSAELLRKAEAGEVFTITVGGRPVAQLGPTPRPPWVQRETFRQALAGLRADKTLSQQLMTHSSVDVTGVPDPWESR